MTNLKVIERLEEKVALTECLKYLVCPQCAGDLTEKSKDDDQVYQCKDCDFTHTDPNYWL